MELALEDMGKPIGEEDYQLIHSGCGEVEWLECEFVFCEFKHRRASQVMLYHSLYIMVWDGVHKSLTHPLFIKKTINYSVEKFVKQ